MFRRREEKAMRRCLASIRTRTDFPIAQGAPSCLPPVRGLLWRTEEGREGLAAVLGPVTQSQCAQQVTKGTRAQANREGTVTCTWPGRPLGKQSAEIQ